MKRRNPSQAAQLNSPIELTPLLDVIFIFLFFVLIGSTALYNKRLGELEERENSVNEKIEEQLDTQSEIDALQERLDYYENGVLSTKVRIVTVFCEYSEDDNTEREIRILYPGDTESKISLDDQTKQTALDQLEADLQTFISSNSNYDIVLVINEENILNRDYNSINKLMEDLEEQNENVYR